MESIINHKEWMPEFISQLAQKENKGFDFVLTSSPLSMCLVYLLCILFGSSFRYL